MLAARLLPCSALLTRSSSSPSTTCVNKTCYPTGINVALLRSNLKNTRICAVGVAQNSLDDTWEDPDDGDNSDYESEEEEEEEGWESEQEASIDDTSVAATSTTTTTISSINEDLVREVEQLLSPDEKAILEQNEAPVLSKISTTKWGILQSLALSQQIPFMDKLLVQGVAIDAPDKDGLTPLHKAIIGKREAVISHLLRRGANPHVKDKNGATALHYAVQVGAIQTVKLLIKYKVDVNAEDNEGWTPLHVAIQSRCRDIAKFLLVNGADKTRRTKDGTSVLDLCLCYGKDFKSYDLTKLVKLVPAGIDP